MIVMTFTFFPDFEFLLRFLRVRKFSQLGARETLENYWTCKAKSPEWFQNMDPADENVQKGGETLLGRPLPIFYMNNSQ